jgi:hypothetical protein
MCYILCENQIKDKKMNVKKYFIGAAILASFITQAKKAKSQTIETTKGFKTEWLHQINDNYGQGVRLGYGKTFKYANGNTFDLSANVYGAGLYLLPMVPYHEPYSIRADIMKNGLVAEANFSKKVSNIVNIGAGLGVGIYANWNQIFSADYDNNGKFKNNKDKNELNFGPRLELNIVKVTFFAHDTFGLVPYVKVSGTCDLFAKQSKVNEIALQLALGLNFGK